MLRLNQQQRCVTMKTAQEILSEITAPADTAIAKRDDEYFPKRPLTFFRLNFWLTTALFQDQVPET
jgi:hypothetical protein